MSERPVAPTNCFFQGCYNPAYKAEIRRAKDACHRFNQLSPNDREAHLAILRELLGEMGRETVITPPFWCDYGYNITVGDFFYSNHNLIITDGARVAFGDHVFVAPNGCFTTAEHAIDPEMRKAGIEVAKPITVGNNVWIGAGSAVTRSIPANVVAAGVPCRVLREIDGTDRTRYPMYQPEERVSSAFPAGPGYTNTVAGNDPGK